MRARFGLGAGESGTADPLRAEIVEDASELLGLADEWRRLATERGNAFVTPEWFFAALRTVDHEVEPCVPVVRGADGALRGLIGLVTDREGRVRFCGAEPADRLHPAARSRDEDRVAAAAARALSNRGRAWRAIRFDRVDAEARWPRAFARAWRPSLRIVPDPLEMLPYIPLEGQTWEEYLATRSRGLRSQLGRRMRSLKRDHEVELIQVESPKEVAEGLTELFRLHDMRSRTIERQSALEDPRVRELHRRFAADALERGWLRFCLLAVDGTAIAAWYGWMIGGRFAYYQAGFDPAWSRATPGALLLAETVRIAAEERATEYDMLRGGEAFKLRFAEGERHGSSLLLAPLMHPALIRAAAGRARSWARNRLELPGFARRQPSMDTSATGSDGT
jgi:CelD/BcsL family acetyltransferase involved in cellulose biosynthesis